MDDFNVIADIEEFGTIDAQLSAETITKLDESDDIMSATAEVRGWWRGINRFTIGTPLVFPLNEVIPADQRVIPAQLAGYEFYRVQLACTFDPALHCRFHDASFAIVLETEPGEPEAIAYDIFPLDVSDEYKLSTKAGISPEIKLDMKLAKAEVKLGSAERGGEHIAYTSRIQGYGLQTARVRWQFSRTQSREMAGSQPLFLIICKAPGTVVRARFSMEARIDLLFPDVGPIGPFPVSTTFRKSGHLIDELETIVC